jgi:deoxycytidylate deaminase
MSAKTQKNWRELCRDLHNEQESGNLMDIVRELNGTLEQLVVEMRPCEGLSAAPAESDAIVQSPRSAVTNRMNG